MDSRGRWTDGPDPGGGPISGGPTLAAWEGVLYVAYRKSDGIIYWNKFNGTSWTPGYSTGFASAHSPTLASGSEDPFPGATRRLWLVYESGCTVYYSYLHIGGFTTPMSIGQTDQDYGEHSWWPANVRRPAAAVFRGRLHVAVVDDNIDLWYASCAMPCGEPSDWTRIVKQDSSAEFGDLALESFGTNDGRLHLWRHHWDPDTRRLYMRSKASE
jgi:hypothetical protein